MKTSAVILQRHILHHLQRALSSHRDNHISQRLRREPRLRVAESQKEVNWGSMHAILLGRKDDFYIRAEQP